MDIATYRLHWPWGLFSENLTMPAYLKDLLKHSSDWYFIENKKKQIPIKSLH